MSASGNIVVFDIETQRDLASVGGPSHMERLGLSVAVAYLVAERRFAHYEEHNVGELIALLRSADLVVGYNIRHFDLRVLGAYADHDLTTLPMCDMIEHVQAALGYRLRLDSLAKQTLGAGKSADGFLALQWWREGKLELIRDYCQQDVELTRRLWEYGRTHGYLWYWDQRRRQRARVPVRW